MQKLLLLMLLAAAPGVTFAQGPPVSQQAQATAIEKILVGEDTRNADLIREAMQEGAQRRRGIRALGRLEQPEQIRYVAPALGDGVGIRAEAAWALAQLARHPRGRGAGAGPADRACRAGRRRRTMGGVGRARGGAGPPDLHVRRSR